jgi:hypothetical protein
MINARRIERHAWGEAIGRFATPRRQAPVDRKRQQRLQTGAPAPHQVEHREPGLVVRLYTRNGNDFTKRFPLGSRYREAEGEPTGS